MSGQDAGVYATIKAFTSVSGHALSAVPHAVALVARSSRAKALVGYSRVEETAAPAAPPAGGG
jgi:hypothetical protein